MISMKLQSNDLMNTRLYLNEWVVAFKKANGDEVETTQKSLT